MTKVKKKSIFKNRKKRRIATALIIVLPLLLACFFGYKIFTQAKDIISMAQGSTGGVSDKYLIDSMDYVLRDNATDYQMELFTELKNMIENQNPEVTYTEEEIVASIAKNHVADYYTWTNKTAQYDVGGLYFVNKEGRKDVIAQSWDTLYEYLNEYMKKYGSENLLEVENVEATVTKSAEKYPITNSKKVWLGGEDWTEEFYTNEYVAYDVKCTWTYKANDVFSTKKYPTSSMYRVIYNEEEERYEIVAAGTTLTPAKVTENSEVSSND